MKIKILIFGLLLLSSNPTVSKTENKPQDKIQNIEPDYEVAIMFINDYIAFCNVRNSSISRIEWIENRTDVTTEFKTELKKITEKAEKEYPEFGLDFDPIIDAQDHPKKFKIDNKDSKYLIVKGTDWSSFRVILKLKFDLNKWLVDGSGVINIPKDKQLNR